MSTAIGIYYIRMKAKIMPSAMSTPEKVIPLCSLNLFEKKIVLELVFYPDFKPLLSFSWLFVMGKLVLIKGKLI